MNHLDRFVLSCVTLCLVGALALPGCGDGGSGGGGSGGSGGQGTTTSSDTTASGGSGGSGGSAATGGAGGTNEVQLGDIAVTVDYAGAQTGTLNIAAVTSFPPSGPPVAFQTFPTPTFPQTGTLIGLEVGKPVYVVAVLDIGNDNPQSPGPEDLVAITMPAVEVVANSEVAVDLTLTDK